jgi:asparagine synthase (glutamine-hydrolysing)
LAKTIAPTIRESSTGNHRPRRIREFLGSGAKSLPNMYEDWIAYFTPEEIAGLLGQRDLTETREVIPGWFANAPGGDFVDQANYVDLKTFLPNNLLRYSDRMSMAHALEIRVPFCDHRLIEFITGIRSSQKMRWMECKRLFKDAVRPWLPPEILKRKKLGFNPPMGMWINRELRSMVDEQLDPARLRRQGYFDPVPVRQMIDAHRAEKRDYSLHIWSLLVFQTWVDLYQ